MIRGFPKQFRPGIWRQMSPPVYTALVAQLFRASGSIKLEEAMLVGMMGGLASARAGDLWLSILTALTTIGTIALVPRCRAYRAMRLEERPAPEVRKIEQKFEWHSYLISAGISAMAIRGLLASDDTLVHLLLLMIVLGATSTNIRHHYRPHITFAKTVINLGPTAIALVLTGNPYYMGAAVVWLLAAKVFLDICSHLYVTAEALLRTVQEKKLLAEALSQRNKDFRQRERQQHEVEKALQRLQADLIHVSRINAMGTMASTLAHEINQPLSALTNYLRGSRRLLDKGKPKDIADAREALVMAEETADRAAQIVRRIRALVFRGQVETKPQALTPLIDAACDMALADAALLGVEWSVEIEDRAKWVNVDGVQIQQVLINLVRNAVEAMGGSAERRIGIRAEAISSSLVQISVTDSGPGIAEAMRDTIFSSFQTTKPEGMGIGLSISRTIVEAHGGQIWVDPAPGSGATFRLTLPRWKMMSDKAEQPSASGSQSA